MSSQAPSVSSGVRNLRAMFENKDTSSSPPDRGRSPALSIGSNGTSPRPLSKVRTSFVAVERGGQLGIQFGLKRDTSTDSDMANRRGSFSMNEEADASAIVEKKKSIADEYQARKQSNAISETIPEVAVESPLPDNDKVLGQAPKGQAAATAAAAAAAAASRLGKSPEKASSAVEKGTKSGEMKSTKAISSAALTAGPTTKAAPTASTQKFNVSKSSAKPAPISTNAASASRPAKPPLPKTPTTPSKTPTTPSYVRPITTKPAATSSKDAVKPTATKTVIPTASASVPKPHRHQSAAATKKHTTSTGTASSTGFVKPRPKSPTKPVKLPPSMTAPTTSSLSKLNSSSAPAAPVRHTAGPSQPAATRSRSPSRTAAAKTEAPVRRQPSITARGRSSIGPPPAVKKQPSRSSLSKNVAPADEGFLARMMRPTTSSASKTHEKLTPEKAKLASRPVTRDGHHEVIKEGSVGSPSKSRERSVKAIRKSIPSKSAEIAVPAVAAAAATVAVASTATAAAAAAPTLSEIEPAESASEGPAVQETPAVSSVEETIPEVAEEPDIEDEKAAEPASVAEEPALVEADEVAVEEAAIALVEEPESQVDGPADEITNGPSEIKDVEEDASEDEQEIVDTPEIAEAEEEVEPEIEEEEVAHVEETNEDEKEEANDMIEQGEEEEEAAAEHKEVSVPVQVADAEEEAESQTEPVHPAELSQIEEQDEAEEVLEDKDTPEDSEKEDDDEEEKAIATKKEEPAATAVANPEPVKEEPNVAEPQGGHGGR